MGAEYVSQVSILLIYKSVPLPTLVPLIWCSKHLIMWCFSASPCRLMQFFERPIVHKIDARQKHSLTIIFLFIQDENKSKKLLQMFAYLSSYKTFQCLFTTSRKHNNGRKKEHFWTLQYDYYSQVRDSIKYKQNFFRYV